MAALKKAAAGTVVSVPKQNRAAREGLSGSFSQQNIKRLHEFPLHICLVLYLRHVNQNHSSIENISPSEYVMNNLFVIS